MGFESGSVSFRFFELPRSFPEDAVPRFAEQALSGVQQVHAEEVKGWVTGRHLLDRNITEDTALYGGIYRLGLTRAERKIPAALLKAECTMEEMAQLAASGRDFLNRKDRKEIKDSVTDRLLPNMPPSLSSTPFVHDPTKGYLMATALNDKQIEQFAIYFRHTLGYELMVCDPEQQALRLKKINADDLPPVSYTPEMEDAYADRDLGRDFLTWLWFASETRPNRFETPAGPVAVLIEGPLTFVYEGTGAHETVLRKGEPVNSAEAKTCLLNGKKLQAAKITLAGDDEESIWPCTFNASTWSFRSMKLPETDAPDPVSRFQDRITSLDQYRTMFSALYEEFLTLRTTPDRWPQERQAVHAWVRERSARR